MAALEGDAELHFDDQNNVEIQFIDEEDLPLANFIEHRASDEEFYSGASESSSDDSSEELEEEDHTDNEVELDEEDWSREIGRRVFYNCCESKFLMHFPNIYSFIGFCCKEQA